MRSYAAFIAPFVVAALAQDSSENSTVVAISSGSATISTTVPYTNGFTSYLTETNSLGVVTGMPDVATSQSALPALPNGVSTQPDAITTQPAVATIPAGLPTGLTYIVQNISRSLTSFEVSVGISSTVVLNSPTGISITTGGPDSLATVVPGGSNSNGDDSSSSMDSPSGTSGDESGSGTASGSAASSTSSEGAASSNLKYASAGVLGFGAFVFALL